MIDENQKRIRFGLLCQAGPLPAWQLRIIDKLLATEGIDLVLRIESNKSTVQDQQAEGWTYLGWKWYAKNRLSKKSKAERLVDLPKSLKDCPVLTCAVHKDGDGKEYFSEEQVEEIKAKDLDFLLKFGFGELTGTILTSTRYGVWAFAHQEAAIKYGTPSYFWPVYKKELISGAALLQLGDSEYRILKQGFLKTKHTHAKNKDQVLFELSTWPIQACVDIYNGQTANWEKVDTAHWLEDLGLPTNGQLLNFIRITGAAFIKKAFKSLFYTDYWNIGVIKAPIQAFLNPEQLPPVNWFSQLPKSKFIADPFALQLGDKTHIIYEEYPFKDGLGKISALEFENEHYKDAGPLIEEPFHMSYPFLLEYEDEVYCIPETYQAGQVRLYKATQFPLKWEFEKVLIDNYEGIDNTLIYHNDLWYLFSTDKKEGVHHNLKIHYAETPFGDWQAHPKNPVKTDIRSARPAGNLFYEDGKLYRPSMDYSVKVEGRIIINRIEKLTPTDFKEINQCIIDPFKNTFFSDKTHTLGAAGPYTIIDGAKELFVLTNIHALRFKLRALYRKLTLKTLKK